MYVGCWLKVNVGNQNSRLVKREEAKQPKVPAQARSPEPVPREESGTYGFAGEGRATTRAANNGGSAKSTAELLKQQLDEKTQECATLHATNAQLSAANAELQDENATLKAELKTARGKLSTFSTSSVDSDRIDEHGSAADGARPRASTFSGTGRKSADAAAVLHPALAAFVPLSEAAGPARVQQREGDDGIHALQAAIRANPDDKAARSALRKSLAFFVTALKVEIGRRLSGQYF